MARDWSLRPDENVVLVYQSRLFWTAAAFGQFSRPNHDELVGRAMIYVAKPLGMFSAAPAAIMRNGRRAKSRSTDCNLN